MKPEKRIEEKRWPRQTEAGKTTNLAARMRDIILRNRGSVIVDPHGPLVGRILERILRDLNK